jgi:hypothetical protein
MKKGTRTIRPGNAPDTALSEPTNVLLVPLNRNYLSTHELAELVRCSPESIWNKYSEDGEYNGITPVRFGRRLLWPVAKILKVLYAVENSPRASVSSPPRSACGLAQGTLDDSRNAPARPHEPHAPVGGVNPELTAHFADPLRLKTVAEH